jgi:hypothetical protein
MCVRPHFSTLLLWVCLAAVFSCARDSTAELPRPLLVRRGPPAVSAMWLVAGVVAGGRLDSVRAVGATRIKVPDSGANAYYRVFACEATFVGAHLLKGELPGHSARLLFYRGSSACPEWEEGNREGPGQERIWFLRREGQWLRPLDDSWAPYFALRPPLVGPGSASALREELASRLLTPQSLPFTEGN